jgi:glycosyltransferase involved in cell wall biosynthesis
MDVPALLEKATVFMSLSCRETFGLSVVEALASGVPVLVHDLPVFRELLGDAASEFIVDASSPEHVANKLSDMLTNVDKYRHLTAITRDHLVALVDISHYCEKINATYSVMLKDTHALAMPQSCTRGYQ